MKISQQKTGIAEKKPQSSTQPGLSGPGLSGPGLSSPGLSVPASPASIGETKPSDVFASPSAAVWSNYIDSRMKQFGTR